MKTFFKLLLVLCFSWIQAHTVWLETAQNGKINQKQEIKIFFGEGYTSIMPSAKWFSNIKDLELKIVSPSGKEIIVKDKVQNEKYYSAFFTPTEKGVYKISFNHVVKDIHRGMKITYQSESLVNVSSSFKEELVGEKPLQLQVNFLDAKLNKDNTIKVIGDGQAKQREKVTIVSENGWKRTLLTDAEGKAVFKPIWKGKYLIEYNISKEEKGKNEEGQEYNTDYKVITYFFDVK